MVNCPLNNSELQSAESHRLIVFSGGAHSTWAALLHLKTSHIGSVRPRKRRPGQLSRRWTPSQPMPPTLHFPGPHRRPGSPLRTQPLQLPSQQPTQSGRGGGTGLLISPKWSYQVFSLHHLTISSNSMLFWSPLLSSLKLLWSSVHQVPFVTSSTRWMPSSATFLKTTHHLLSWVTSTSTQKSSTHLNLQTFLSMNISCSVSLSVSHFICLLYVCLCVCVCLSPLPLCLLSVCHLLVCFSLCLSQYLLVSRSVFGKMLGTNAC